MDDVMTNADKDDASNADNNDNPAWISIVHAAGGISDEYGRLTLTSTIYKTKECLDLADQAGQRDVWGGPPAFNECGGSLTRGYFPAEGEETEVHLVVRDHGPPMDNWLEQTTTFTDSSCAEKGGSNLCLDIGHVAFPNSEKYTQTIGHFPTFPPGCFTGGSCSAEEEAIQLSKNGYGIPNLVRFIRTGDAVQVVARLILPQVVMNTTRYPDYTPFYPY